MASSLFRWRAWIFCSLWLLTNPLHAEGRYQLEKVVELSRHGIRPPTAGNRKEIEAATQRTWTKWRTPDGELTEHGYSAVMNKGRWQGEHYRQLGLLSAGCPSPADIAVRASPMQRTIATAKALVNGAFPGCSIPVHHVKDDIDPLFQADKLEATQTDPIKELAAKRAKAGNLPALQQRLQPTIQLLKRAVCASVKDCPFFDRPWQFKQTRSGHTYVQGLSAMASMVETLRLGYSENLPFDQLAWGHITSAAQITTLLPLLTANYDLSNDIFYLAQRRGSVLLNAILQGINPGADALPKTRWLLFVAHDTNIAMVRTLIDFHWHLPGYSSGNIPPGSSLVFERWRDSQSGERFIRIYFQAQSLDALRQLQPIDAAHPLLREEWYQPGCKLTPVGTLCPYQSSIEQLRNRLDPKAIVPVDYALPSS
ncbi:MAG: histidine-type phosphatase [Enterobacterales bacterium endosymbiont of Blomia tropicalis]|uniref:histidine-type phosphatase n=1 Tax=Mixta mediterraneensis TaxID=2758443 RepID=UPI0025A6ABAE|nr:histidine-type phosphatase [Mixta mediterraneensis]MDL4913516.1 histidine-type phosphatase [Mixta mediterraneensis]